MMLFIDYTPFSSHDFGQDSKGFPTHSGPSSMKPGPKGGQMLEILLSFQVDTSVILFQRNCL